MDGIHDLGGKEGFGPIDVNEPEIAFREPWEGRMWGLYRSHGPNDWTLDWWRQVRDLIVPSDYLARPYFDQWAQTNIAAYVDSGVFTLEEYYAGKSATPPISQPRVLTPRDILIEDRSQAVRFDRTIEQRPAFKVGEHVRTKVAAPQHHTRLPAYARRKRGLIQAHHGAFVFPDASSQGIEAAQHLYSVAIEMTELWPEAENVRDRVYLDLWESYLVPL